MAAVTICSDFGNVPQCNKGHMTNTANITLSGEKLKAISSKIRNETKMPTFAHFYSTYYWSVCQTTGQEPELKGTHSGKEGVKLSPSTDDMTPYVENLKWKWQLLSHVWISATP